MDRIIDGDFEEWNSSTALTHWVKQETGGSYIQRDIEPYTGNYEVAMYVDASNNSVSISQTFDLVRGRKYKLRLYYKNNWPGKTARILFSDSSSTVYLKEDGSWNTGAYSIVLANSLTYKKLEVSFTAHATYRQYTLVLANQTADTSWILFDTVSVKSSDRCGFFISNLWDTGTLTSSTAATNFPNTNTRHRWHLRPWRSSALTDPQWLKLDKGAEVGARAMIIRKNNFTDGTATVKFQAHASDAWGSPTVDETVGDWDNEIIPLIWPTVKTYQWWRIAITDTTNTAGYVSVGRVYLGTIFEPTRNVIWNTPMPTPTDPSLITESEGGQVFSIQHTIYNSIEAQFQGLSQSDFETLRDHFNTVGMTKNFFFCMDLADPWKTLYYVRFTQPPAWTYRYIDYYNITLAMAELR